MNANKIPYIVMVIIDTEMPIISVVIRDFKSNEFMTRPTYISGMFTRHYSNLYFLVTRIWHLS
jgi:hypothetical protein